MSSHRFSQMAAEDDTEEKEPSMVSFESFMGRREGGGDEEEGKTWDEGVGGEDSSSFLDATTPASSLAAALLDGTSASGGERED